MIWFLLFAIEVIIYNFINSVVSDFFFFTANVNGLAQAA